MRNSLIVSLALAFAPALAFAQDPDAEPMEDDPGMTEPTPEPAATDTPVEATPPTPPASTDENATTVKYVPKKGLTIESADGDFELKISFRIQARWTLERDLADGGEIEHFFSIPRNRFTAEGKIFGTVEVKMQAELGGQGRVYLRDGYMDWTLGGGPVHLRFGQWKRPFGRQQITSSSKLQFVDRSLTDRSLNEGRDVGVALHNGYEGSPAGVEWAVGIFNGAPDRPAITCDADVTDPAMPAIACDTGNVPSDIGPTAVVRVGWNSSKDLDGYREYDWEGGPARFGVAANYRIDIADGTSDEMMHYVGADAIFKSAGLSISGGFGMVRSGADGAENDLVARVQGGYFISPKKAEIGARWAMVPDGDETDMEVLGVYNCFMQANALMFQLDGGAKLNGGDGEDPELLLRAQTQVIF